MAGEERSPAPDLTRLAALAKEPERYHIFKAIRLIEAVYHMHPRLGRSRRPSHDVVRLHQEPELAFPPSTVMSFRPAEGDRPGRLSNRFFGLWGPHGPLPLHLTEYARDRMRNWRDPTLVAFANTFHHRMTGLLYRAWATAEPAPSYDRPDDDPFSRRLSAFVGILGEGFASRDALPDRAKLSFSGRFSHGAKNEEGLLAVIAHFFRAKVEVQSFVGSWLWLDRCDLFVFPGARPANRLGESITVGDRVWSRQAKFRVRIGPLGLDAYRRLLPGGDSLQRLRAIVRNYTGEMLDWDVNLVLKSDEVPQLSLGRQGELGWTTWIGRRPPGRDADDLMLVPQDRPAPGPRGA